MLPKAVGPVPLVFVACLLVGPGGVSAQRRHELHITEKDAYDPRFFDQLRSLFGKFQEADLQRVFQQAKPIQCSNLVGGKGEWREVAFFNEDRKLGDWCRDNLDEVRADLSIYIFKGACRDEQETVQVSTEYPVGESIEAFNDGRIGLDQVLVTVNAPVDTVFNPRTLAYTFELPYLFRVGRQDSTNIYSFIAPHPNAAYANEVTSFWECKAVASSDVTYRFLICRARTVARGAAAKAKSQGLSFGASAYFVLSDGTEPKTSVNLSFGDVVRPADASTGAAPGGTTSSHPSGTNSAQPRGSRSWRMPDSGTALSEIETGEFRLRFSPQTWTGKIGSPQVLSEQKLSSLQLTGPPQDVDYCIWHPGLLNLVDRLLLDLPEADVVFSAGTFEKSGKAAASIQFEAKTAAGARLGTLQCFFSGKDSPGSIPLDRWISIVGGHLTMEIRK